MTLRYRSAVCSLSRPCHEQLLIISAPRMWTLSLLCALVGSATNLFFSLRYPSVFITPVIALVVVHPLGRTWDRILKCHDDPIDHFENGKLGSLGNPPDHLPWKRRMRLWLAQGRWNEKEHACVYVSSNVSFGFAFATDVGARDHRCLPVPDSYRSSWSKQNSTNKISASYINSYL